MRRAALRVQLEIARTDVEFCQAMHEQTRRPCWRVEHEAAKARLAHLEEVEAARGKEAQ